MKSSSNGATPSQYDVFISYATPEGEWVRGELYDRLMACTRKTGRGPPRIFFAEESIRVASVWFDTLVDAVANCRRFLPVYSGIYFRRRPCEYELKLAMERWISGNEQLICPISRDPGFRPPLYLQPIQFLTTGREDWFAVLCESLLLDPPDDHQRLSIVDGPAEIVLHRTLPPMRIKLTGAFEAGVQVSVRLSGGELFGTSTVVAQNGEAVFDDLTVETASDEVIVEASAPGFGHTKTAPLRVVEPASVSLRHRATATRSSPTGPRRVAIVPLGEDHWVAVDEASIQLVSRDGAVLVDRAPFEMTSPRSVRVADDGVVVLDWQGSVHAVDHHGVTRHCLRGHDRDPSLVGDVAFDEDGIWIGCWDGRLLFVARGSSRGQEPQEVLRHPFGIQRLVRVDDALVFVDLRGTLVSAGVESAGVLASTVEGPQLEPLVQGLWARSGWINAIGSTSSWRVGRDFDGMVSEPHAIADVHSVSVASRSPVLVAPDGRGLRIDDHFNLVARFRAEPGAVSMCADDAGSLCVLECPVMGSALVHRFEGATAKIVHTRPSGSIGVSRKGDVAIAEGDALRVFTIDEILELR